MKKIVFCLMIFSLFQCSDRKKNRFTHPDSTGINTQSPASTPDLSPGTPDSLLSTPESRLGTPSKSDYRTNIPAGNNNANSTSTGKDNSVNKNNPAADDNTEQTEKDTIKYGSGDPNIPGNGTIPPTNRMIPSTDTGEPGSDTGPQDTEIIKILTIKEADQARMNMLVGDLMKFTLSIILFFFSMIMYSRSRHLLQEVKNTTSPYKFYKDWTLLPIVIIGTIWGLYFNLEQQGLILLLTSFFLISSTLPFLLASLNFTNAIHAIRKNEENSKLLTSESFASLIFSLVGFIANIFKIIVFINHGK